MDAPANKFIQETLYELGRDYGITSVDFYKVGAISVDTETGATSQTLTKTVFRRPLWIAQSEAKKVAYSLFSEKFKFEGAFNVDARLVVIPTKVQATTDDYFVWQHKKYAVMAIEEIGNGCLIIVAKHVTGEVPREIYEITQEEVWQLGDSNVD